MFMVELLGWLGAGFLAGCGIPQAVKAYRTKKTNDISWLFINMWLFGEIFVLGYIIDRDWTQYPLIVNYIFNIIVILSIVLAKYKYDTSS